MRALQYNRRSTEKFVIKGIVGNDNATITYTDEDGDIGTIGITSALSNFTGQSVTISIQMNTEEDLLDNDDGTTEEEIPVVDDGTEEDIPL